MPWKAAVAPGGSASFGFLGSWTGSTPGVGRVHRQRHRLHRALTGEPEHAPPP
ncbi:hypothetical protein AB0G04_11445 [Actinoplanes sp. NPDC023801]|uniref:hypothetical protein n=1 Tax=Actinoplanes sp. NPDC023801 TaxID=3154595 RepID=UPI003402D52A